MLHPRCQQTHTHDTAHKETSTPRHRVSLCVCLPHGAALSCCRVVCTAASPPGLQLHTLQGVGVRVPEEDGWAARHAAGVRHSRSIQQRSQAIHVRNTQAEVAVTPAVLCISGSSAPAGLPRRDRQGSQTGWETAGMQASVWCRIREQPARVPPDGWHTPERRLDTQMQAHAGELAAPPRHHGCAPDMPCAFGRSDAHPRTPEAAPSACRPPFHPPQTRAPLLSVRSAHPHNPKPRECARVSSAERHVDAPATPPVVSCGGRRMHTY